MNLQTIPPLSVDCVIWHHCVLVFPNTDLWSQCAGNQPELWTVNNVIDFSKTDHCGQFLHKVSYIKLFLLTLLSGLFMVWIQQCKTQERVKLRQIVTTNEATVTYK